MSDFLGQKFLLNGEVKSISEWNDEEFINRPTIYDVVRVEDGVPLFFEDYYQRLINSFLLVEKKFNYSYDELIKVIDKLLEVNDYKSVPVKFLFQYTKPEAFVSFIMKPHLPLETEYATGVHTIFLHKQRINPNAKVWNQKMRNSTILELNNAEAYEGILVDENGYVTEGSRSNVFFIKDGIVYTSPNDCILPGITRKKVLQICELNGIEVIQQMIRADGVNNFDAAFLTGTSRKVLPVKAIGDIQFSVENSTMTKIILEFERLVGNYIRKAKTNRK